MAAYIKFDGVTGECKDKDHKGWSDLLRSAKGFINPAVVPPVRHGVAAT